MKSDEMLDSPITGQWRSSPFYVALGSPALASLLSILCSWVCYAILPEDAAREQMTQINTMLLVGGGGGALTGAYGIVARGLEITKAKIKKQLPAELPQTVNAGSATFGSEGGAAPESQTPVLDDYSRSSEPVESFDVGDLK